MKNTLLSLQNLLSHIPSIYSLDAPFVNAVKEAIKMIGVVIRRKESNITRNIKTQ